MTVTRINLIDAVSTRDWAKMERLNLDILMGALEAIGVVDAHGNLIIVSYTKLDEGETIGFTQIGGEIYWSLDNPDAQNVLGLAKYNYDYLGV